MQKTKTFCEKCGKPARFHLADPGNASKIIHHFCFYCAISMSTQDIEHQGRLSRYTIMITAGFIVLVLSLLAYLL